MLEWQVGSVLCSESSAGWTPCRDKSQLWIILAATENPRALGDSWHPNKEAAVSASTPVSASSPVPILAAHIPLLPHTSLPGLLGGCPRAFVPALTSFGLCSHVTSTESSACQSYPFFLFIIPWDSLTPSLLPGPGIFGFVLESSESRRVWAQSKSFIKFVKSGEMKKGWSCPWNSRTLPTEAFSPGDQGEGRVLEKGA